MPRARGSESEVPQRQSPRASFPIKIPSPNSDNRQQGSVKRNSTSPKTVIRRSPPNPPLEKRGMRISDLESKLGKSQNKVKQLKEQLASAEAAKIEAEKELERTKKLIPQAETSKSELEKITDDNSSPQIIMESSPETDVFIVQEVKSMNQISENEEKDKKSPESFAKNDTFPTSLGNELISELKAKLIKTEEELKNISTENNDLKKKVSEAMAESAMEASLAQAKEEEAAMKLRKMEQEMQEMKARTSQISELLEITEKSKEDLESEMKRLRIQTDQWRKAADAAANVLAMESDVNGPKVGERCGSMNKNMKRFETPGLDSYVSTLMTMDDLDDCLVASKRKGGIRMFGDLWKKKAQK